MRKFQARATGRKASIVGLEIDKETTCYVWVNGRQTEKQGGGGSFFDTFEQAKEFILARLGLKVANAERELFVAKDRLKDAEKLTEGEG